MSKIENISWESVEKMIENIANQISISGFKADFIAPIPKGGWTVAALLAQHLNIKKSLSIAQSKTSSIVNTYIADNAELEGKKILIVEDSIETGKGLFRCKE